MPDEITAARPINIAREGTPFHRDAGSAAASVPSASALCQSTPLSFAKNNKLSFREAALAAAKRRPATRNLQFVEVLGEGSSSTPRQRGVDANWLAGSFCQSTPFHADEGRPDASAPSENSFCKGTASAVPKSGEEPGVLTPEANGISPHAAGRTGSNDLRARIDVDLSELREYSQFRSLDLPVGLNLCSNDYLGLAADPRLKQAVLDGVASCARVASTGSRLLSGNSREWEEIESEFANFVGAESALYFTSGYAANVGLLSSILHPNDIVFSDALNHASLIDGIRLSRAQKIIYPHRNLQFLENALQEHAGAPGAKLIVTESIFSMEGDVAPLAELLTIADCHDADLIVDEAHAIGVCGPEGRGVVAGLSNRTRILAAIYPCGKALASCGAFVCCSAPVKDYLVNHARSFIFSTANPPYITHQIRAALALVSQSDDRRAHLRRISAALRAELIVAGLNCGSGDTPIIPVILGSNESALRVASELQNAGFAVKAIRPPTVPPGSARIRLSLTSNISLEDVHRLARVLISAAGAARLASSSSSAHA
jgi:8-amino-7-oxononanoate synthase